MAQRFSAAMFAPMDTGFRRCGHGLLWRHHAIWSIPTSSYIAFKLSNIFQSLSAVAR